MKKATNLTVNTGKTIQEMSLDEILSIVGDPISREEVCRQLQQAAEAKRKNRQ